MRDENRKRELFDWEEEIYKFPGSISIGTGLKSVDDFRKTFFLVGGLKLIDMAEDAINSPEFSVSPQEVRIRLNVASTQELTGKEKATAKEIFDAISKIGNLCPAEVGPFLRFQYANQRHGERLNIAMNPIADAFSGEKMIFKVDNCDYGILLDADPMELDDVFEGYVLWVYASR